MNDILDEVFFAIPCVAATVSIVIYLASFFGIAWPQSTSYALCLLAFVSNFLTSIPTMIRDHRFFSRYWDCGIWSVRQKFPFRMFPARRVTWLEPLGWCMMGVIVLHFFLLILEGQSQRKTLERANIYEPQATSSENENLAEIRLFSLMATCAGIGTALSWKYPPVERPQSSAIKSLDS